MLVIHFNFKLLLRRLIFKNYERDIESGFYQKNVDRCSKNLSSKHAELIYYDTTCTTKEYVVKHNNITLKK